MALCNVPKHEQVECHPHEREDGGRSVRMLRPRINASPAVTSVGHRLTGLPLAQDRLLKTAAELGEADSGVNLTLLVPDRFGVGDCVLMQPSREVRPYAQVETLVLCARWPGVTLRLAETAR